MHINVEIKAKSDNQQFIRQTLIKNNAYYKGVDFQIDTYFNVSFGRLKLREGQIENYLIHYNRSDIEGPKQSDIVLYKSDIESNLKQILTKSLGVLVVVSKKREIYFIDNVKFHIDTVEKLGNFVEIEAIDTDGQIGKEKLLEQCNFYLNLLKINENDLIANSYSDLLIKKSK